jgi:hypothetical protein
VPASPFLISLVNNSVQGGGVAVSGAILANIGTYTITLTNTSLTQTMVTTLTIILKDPCDRAVFESTPSPFSDITVQVPSATLINTTFKVWTDVERNYNLVCAISASFTTTYAPISVSSPYDNTVVNPALVSLPNDIGTGPNLSHSVTI